MEWKRFPVPKFDYKALRGMTYEPPGPISATQAQVIATAAATVDASVAGGYAVEPDPSLLDRFNVRGEHAKLVLCALPRPDGHLLGRSRAWFNQRAFVLDGNTADAAVLYEWRTLRTFNTCLGPEDGVTLNRAAIWILSGRILGDHTRANRVMIDSIWTPDGDRKGFRVIAASDAEPNEFHDSCFELTWPS